MVEKVAIHRFTHAEILNRSFVMALCRLKQRCPLNSVVRRVEAELDYQEDISFVKMWEVKVTDPHGISLPQLLLQDA